MYSWYFFYFADQNFIKYFAVSSVALFSVLLKSDQEKLKHIWLSNFKHSLSAHKGSLCQVWLGSNCMTFYMQQSILYLWTEIIHSNVYSPCLNLEESKLCCNCDFQPWFWGFLHPGYCINVNVTDSFGLKSNLFQEANVKYFPHLLVCASRKFDDLIYLLSGSVVVSRMCRFFFWPHKNS